MEIVWSSPNKLIDSEVSVFSIGYLEEGDYVRVFYRGSCGHATLRHEFEVVVNRGKAGFCGKGVNLGLDVGEQPAV
jgi:hypothetical protein